MDNLCSPGDIDPGTLVTVRCSTTGPHLAEVSHSEASGLGIAIQPLTGPTVSKSTIHSPYYNDKPWYK